MAKKDTTLAPVEEFRLLRPTDGIDPEILAEIEDELTDLDQASEPNYLKIKVPTSGGLAYAVQDDEDGEDYKKTIDAVIVYTHNINGRWARSYGEGGDPALKIPVCASVDGKTGFNRETGEVINCRMCPFNEYGTGVDKDGKPTRGKACKNMRRIYLKMSGDPALYLLTVPPTSLKDVNRQLKKILDGGTPYIGLVVRFSLARTQSASGSDYSKVVLRKVGTLPAPVVRQGLEIRKKIKEQFAAAAVTIDDYQAAPAEPAAPADPAPVQDNQAAGDPVQVDPSIFEEAPSVPSDGSEDLPF